MRQELSSLADNVAYLWALAEADGVVCARSEKTVARLVEEH